MPRIIRYGRSQIRYVARALGGFPVVINLLSVLAVAAAVADPDAVLSRGAVLASVALIVGRTIFHVVADMRTGVPQRQWVGNSIVARVATTAGALAIGMAHDADGWTVIAALILLVLLIGEQTLRRPLGSAIPQAAHLPRAEVALPSTGLALWIFVVDTAGMALLALSGAFGVSPLPAVVTAVVGTVMMLLIGLQAVRFLVQRRRVEADLPRSSRSSTLLSSFTGRPRPALPTRRRCGFPTSSGSAHRTSCWSGPSRTSSRSRR